MTKTTLVVVGLVLLLSGTQFADDRTDWVGTLTNPEIQYRTEVYDNAEACYVEFRDLQQGPESTSFDAQLDYKSTDLYREGQPETKTDGEHIVTTSTHTGHVRISHCARVVAVRLRLVQRS